ncbi:class I adenylate-forming enzyme family protein [Rhodococcus sp. DMU1]|uniref:class I adenylate-forming enzyme family protein n=1 Tax=Rhodococcus sp. DMU1 TaxID=2722825 RepID=UPI00143E7E47|nr:class I adenylate-forming enzyme family protein [Rhodococcus sp. DMU1]QIX53762.1 acyl--CoA ligase [Rhodococcus sp. DMU1]
MTESFLDYATLPGRAAERWPDRVALEFEGERWTFEEFDRAIRRTQTLLSEAGVRTGMRTVLLMENSPEYLVAQFALARIGVAFVTPNPYWTDGELSRTLAPVDAHAAIVSDRHRHWADEYPVHLRAAEIRRELLNSGSAAARSTAPGDPERELCIPFSSGTTGLPKGVVHTTASLSGGVGQLVRHLRLSADDRLQVSLPLCHIFGTSMAAAAMAAGARVTLFERFEFDRCFQQLREGAVTVWPLAGAVAHRLAELPDLSRDHVPALRFFMWGGSAVPRHLASLITERTGIGFLCSYGMTEAFATAFNPVDDPTQWRLDSPGFATVGTEIRLGADDEIEVRSPCVARGYTTESAEGTDRPFRPGGWFRTGDVGRIDADGRLWIVDRRKDMIKVSGFQVAPAEVEYELMRHPAVTDAAAIGRPDDRRGERVVAFVVASAPVSSEEVLATLRGRLASYKIPGEIVFVDRLPRTSAGKLQRALLRRQ